MSDLIFVRNDFPIIPDAVKKELGTAFECLLCLDQVVDPDTGILSISLFYQFFSSDILQGALVEMTLEEEKLLAEGKNFEHSGGSVSRSRLEIMFRAMYLIDVAYLNNIDVNTCCSSSLI
jgi:hypothetical protein